MAILRFLRARFGRYVDKELGYSVRVTYNNFPGMDVQYAEGPRTMTVMGEVMANGRDLDLGPRNFGRWEPPFQSEPIDDAHKSLGSRADGFGIGAHGFGRQVYRPSRGMVVDAFGGKGGISTVDWLYRVRIA